jgi:hypothetical protein
MQLPASYELSVAAYTGIGVGAGTTILIIMGAIPCMRPNGRLISAAKRHSRELRRSLIFELSGGIDSIAQLEARERILELPGGGNDTSDTGE